MCLHPSCRSIHNSFSPSVEDEREEVPFRKFKNTMVCETSSLQIVRLIFGLAEVALTCIPIQLESMAMPMEERLWLNDEQRLLPCSNHPGQKHEEHAIRFGTGGSFHLSAEGNELLMEQCVFCHEFGLASGKVSH